MFRESQVAAEGFHGAVGFFAKQPSNAADFVVNGFERNVGCHCRRNVMLQRRTEHAAEHRNHHQPHQDACERSAEMKPTVKKNHRQCEKSEPEMPTHPGLRTTDSHFAEPWPSISAKNVRGSTRCAASCGQA